MGALLWVLAGVWYAFCIILLQRKNKGIRHKAKGTSGGIGGAEDCFIFFDPSSLKLRRDRSGFTGWEWIIERDVNC